MTTPEDRLIQVGIDAGNEIFFKMLDDYPELDEKDPRRGAVLLSMMTNCVVQLHLAGWSEQSLVNEIFNWCRVARNIIDPEASE